ncbi:MAG TPA: hypothetical protein VLT88_04590 [Desulfosarcina sp.]|nr:hypothetical protein [Desulfosarcina sp.]
MADAALSITISSDDLSTLQDLPGQIETLARTAQHALEAVRTGADTGNPVGALISGLSDLGDAVGEIPALEPLVAPIRDLAAQLPESALGDAAAVGAAIDRVLGLFGPLKDAVLSGRIEEDLTGFIRQALEQTGGLFTPGDEVTALMGELETFFRLLRSMLGWQDHPPSPEDVAELIARALAGMAPDLLDAPSRALEAALTPLEEL